MPQPARWSCVLWDIDGTVVDASEGILHRLGLTMARLGYPAVTREELVYWIGPPMFDSFQAQLGMTPAQAAEAVTLYREISKEDGFNRGAKLFPGMGELISDLHAAGVPQATASSKPENQVESLMDLFGLTPMFDTIVGSTPDERTLASKTDIVAEALRRLRAAGVDTSRPVLVGDRHHDVEGGMANGVPVVFVRWGFSWPHESEGAQAAVDDVEQLRGILFPAEA